MLIAAFLRLYRIADLTEFLGDQGRTGIHIYEAWQKKELPLVGPTVLSGQHLGPAFYYIMAPAFVLSGFHPTSGAVMTALFGIGAVALLWMFARELFGWQIATGLAIVWAVSPQIVSSDRVLWEPNIIPFFIFLYLLSLYKRWHFVAGASLGILVQLHYPNLLFIGLTLLYGFKRNIVFGFLFTLFPFLYYESQHGFEDVIGVLTNYSSGEARFLPNILDYSSRVMHRIAPLTGVLFTLFFFGKLTFWKIFISLWFIVGLVVMSLYRGVVFDHYLFFLLPAAFLLFGFVLSKLNIKLAVILVSMLVLYHLNKTDIFKPGVNDVNRTKAVASEIISLSGNEPFSFGLIASRSFSDLHYRYFFLINNVHPQPILSDSYKNLFLVCETGKCPNIKETIQILCYDAHCEGEYPKIDLERWNIVETKNIKAAQIYFLRKP